MNASDTSIRKVVGLLLLAILVGTLGFVATVQNGRAASSASKADVERTTALTQRVAELQELAARVSSNRSDAAETRQLTLCLRLATLLREFDLPVKGECPANPSPATEGLPTPTPVPS